MEIKTVTKIYSPFSGLHCSYQVTYVDSNRETSVPLNEENTDYQEILKWVADGNTITDNGGAN
tara:strand:- start:308 stop:496 length:189 start_codon:yes stop_codon:yes gene_type:complete